MFLRILGTLICVFFMAIMILFVGVNVMVGCESWEDPGCVSPMDLIN